MYKDGKLKMVKPKIAIIDYKMCNLFSVEHACRYVGGDPIITTKPEDVRSADAVILPGVGAFHDAISNLRELGMDTAIIDVISGGIPFMGICLGFQLLFSSSEEFGTSNGLGVFNGAVRKFPRDVNGYTLKIPQMGWNSISINKESHILKGVNDDTYMYFVHSFYVLPEDNDIILTKTTYSDFEYCSSISDTNVFACQFHPEKSGEEGIKIYRNWVASI